MITADNWTFKYNYVPSRKGDYFTIEHDGMEVDCWVMGWFDERFEASNRTLAHYINARRFSYGNGNRDGLPETFAVRLY